MAEVLELRSNFSRLVAYFYLAGRCPMPEEHRLRVSGVVSVAVFRRLVVALLFPTDITNTLAPKK